MTFHVRCVLYVCLLTVLGACTSPPRVAVQTRDVITERQQTEKIGGSLITFVKRGDTLYSIAFASGLNVAELAAWNGLQQDDKILVGQKVRLTKPLGFKAQPQQKVIGAASPDKKTARPSGEKVVTSVKTVPAKSAPKPKTNSSVSAASKLLWQWPTVGRVVKTFSIAKGQKGIDIAGKPGQEVKASAAGKVVYAGNGLRGYGNLVIVKHNDDYLSAYAHNSQMFVKEGKFVAKGQRISAMGVANSGKTVLHFEIRLQGKPVNPTKYLPKR